MSLEGGLLRGKKGLGLFGRPSQAPQEKERRKRSVYSITSNRSFVNTFGEFFFIFLLAPLSNQGSGLKNPALLLMSIGA